MTTFATQPGPIVAVDDTPLTLNVAPSGPDRAFQLLLASSSGLVLVIMAATVVFLIVNGWSALTAAGIRFVTDFAWAPDQHHFGVLPLLGGSVAIALVAIVVAVPVSLATALMINEYAPVRLRPWLVAVIDLLATVPSIVYGFWGLELVSGLQAAPAKWLVDHVNFIPIFRTPTPGSFVSSIFACGLVSAVTIVPIVTSVSREVMSQAPRDVCEAALGLGGTRWGMVTDVILPFSRNGILAATLLGIGRGLGETMIVVLILSQGNRLTPAIMGPNGLGSIAKQITEYYPTSSPIAASALVLAGLALFVTTLGVNAISRLVVTRTVPQ